MVSGTVAVTGASGMVGRHAFEAIRRSGRAVKAITRAEWDLGRWADTESLDDVFGDARAVIHAGAFTPKVSDDNLERMIAVNVTACAALCDWALARQAHVVYISGAIVYDDDAIPPLTEATPVSPSGFGGIYRLSKVMAETVFQHYAERGLPCTILRATSIYGAGMPASKMIPSFLDTAQSGGNIELRPPVDDEVDLVHAWDVAHAALLVVENESVGVFNIGSEAPVQIRDIAEACVNAAGAGRVTVQSDAATTDADMASRSPIRRFLVSCHQARLNFGYKPSVNLFDGLSLLATKQLAPGGS